MSSRAAHCIASWYLLPNPVVCIQLTIVWRAAPHLLTLQFLLIAFLGEQGVLALPTYSPGPMPLVNAIFCALALPATFAINQLSRSIQWCVSDSQAMAS